MLAYPEGLDDRSAAIQWADWLELNILFSSLSSLSRSDVREVLELRAIGEDEIESIIDDAFDNVTSRALVLGNAYPIEQVGVRISRLRSRDECLSYSFILALGTRHFFSDVRTDDEAARLFEHVTAAAIKQYVNG